MSECKAFRREIGDAWDGGLSREARAHVQSCRPCGEELRGSERLRALVRGLDKVEAPEDFELRLRARMASGGAAGGGGPRRVLRLIYAFAPVAAAACFLVVSATLYLWQPPETTPAVPTRDVSVETARNDAGARVTESPMRGGDAVPGASSVSETSGATGMRVFTTRPAGRRTRAASRPASEVAAKTERRNSPSLGTTLNSFGSAPVVTRQNVTIALKAPAEPLRVILRDERGAGRVVPMRAVSFGAQELITREAGLRRPVVSEDEGVW